MWYFSIPRFVLALALILIAQVSAADLVRFTLDGEILYTDLGYTAGQNVSFSFVLRDYAPETLRVRPDPPYAQSACCEGQFGWHQDLPTQAHLWSDIYGTGITGSWNPINTPSTYFASSELVLWLGHSPSQTLHLQGGTSLNASLNTGLFANGFPVIGFESQAVYFGLDALNVYGDNLFGSPVPDPTALFSGMFGTYTRDSNFSSTSRLYLGGANGGTVYFRVNTLTISAVPIPSAVWLFGSGLLTLLMKLQSRKK